MTERNLPDEELDITNERAKDGEFNELTAPESLDPVTSGEPDSYPDAAEENPDQWRNDPLLQDEPSADTGGEGVQSDQTLRDEADPESSKTPTLGEAAADVDFNDPADESEIDASDDSANLGGSPLGQFEPEDLDR